MSEKYEMHEDLSICARCGGECCKESPCSYSPEDFGVSAELSVAEQIDIYRRVLKDGATVYTGFKLLTESGSGKTLGLLPLLTISERPEGIGALNIGTRKARCSKLTDNGCSFSFEDRPSHAKTFIPKLSESGERLCRNSVSGDEFSKKWCGSQEALRTVVEELSGKDFGELLVSEWTSRAKEIGYKVRTEGRIDESDEEVLELLELMEDPGLLVGMEYVETYKEQIDARAMQMKKIENHISEALRLLESVFGYEEPDEC